MTEELITFTTALLAKEKGFNIETRDYFNKNLPKETRLFTPNKAGKAYYNKYDDKYMSAPTQSLLQKWLREVHSIYVIVLPVMEGFVYGILNENILLTIEEGDNTIMDYVEFLDYSVYGEALEAGLKIGLKKIKDES